jgi:hypothetical protein
VEALIEFEDGDEDVAAELALYSQDTEIRPPHWKQLDRVAGFDMLDLPVVTLQGAPPGFFVRNVRVFHSGERLITFWFPDKELEVGLPASELGGRLGNLVVGILDHHGQQERILETEVDLWEDEFLREMSPELTPRLVTLLRCWLHLNSAGKTMLRRSDLHTMPEELAGEVRYRSEELGLSLAALRERIRDGFGLIQIQHVIRGQPKREEPR